jgi:outer membrane protein OmpA-like peptidoglycan-associated protein
MSLAAALVLALGPATAAAQQFPGFGGIEGRIGLAFAERAGVAAGGFAEADLGYVGTPALRTVVGLNRFVANIDRLPGDDEGSYAATGAWLGLRFDLFGPRTLSPYARAALTLHSVDADAWDPAVGALLDGLYLGAGVAVGAAYAIDAMGRFNGTAEVRHTLMNNIGNTAFEVGLRYQPRGVRTYTPDAPPLWTGPRRQPAVATPRAPAAAPEPTPTPTPPPPTPPAPAPAPTPEPAPTPDHAPERVPDPTRAEAEAARAAAAEAMLRQGLTRAASAMASVADMRETETRYIVTVGGAAFASGAATLTASARAEVRVLATILAGYPGHIVTVVGHTDAVGDPVANRRLSEGRAANVRAALIAEGVDPLWIAALGRGQDHPIATNETAAGRSANRRVEVRVEKARCPVPPVPEQEGLACPGR